MSATWTCNKCGAAFASREQVKKWQYRCGDEGCDGRLELMVTGARVVVDDEELAAAAEVVRRLGVKLRERTTERDVARRELKTVRDKVYDLAKRALESDDPEVHKAALKQLVATGELVRRLELVSVAR